MPESIRDSNTGFTMHINRDGSVGINGSNEKMYVDDTTTTDITYIGLADVGSNEGSSCWQIRVLDETGSTVKYGLYPNGDRSYIFIWDNRVTYTYS